MDIRNTAKLVLRSPRGYILAHGESRRLNLPGGGMRNGESAHEALARELGEELDLDLSEVNPRFIGERIYPVTSKEGVLSLARWAIFEGSTEYTASELKFGKEIRGVIDLRREVLITHPDVTKNARRATALANRSLIASGSLLR